VKVGDDEGSHGARATMAETAPPRPPIGPTTPPPIGGGRTDRETTPSSDGAPALTGDTTVVR
jgi:hypothetical protein